MKNNLAFYREKARLSQKSLAEELNIRQSAISEYESGKREPRVGVALKIFELFKKENEELIFSDLWGKKEELGKPNKNLLGSK